MAMTAGSARSIAPKLSLVQNFVHIARHAFCSMDAIYSDPEEHSTSHRLLKIRLHGTLPYSSQFLHGHSSENCHPSCLRCPSTLGFCWYSTRRNWRLNGHVTLFHSWIDASNMQEYNPLELRAVGWAVVALLNLTDTTVLNSQKPEMNTLMIRHPSYGRGRLRALAGCR